MDVFISYARADEPWAKKLEDELKKNGKSVFRDLTRLVPGEEWAEQLRTKVLQATHMVAFWSKEARESDWVQQELALFAARRPRDNKRLIIVVLEDEPRAYMSFEQIDLIKQNGLYNSGVEALDPKDWTQLVRKTLYGLDKNAGKETFIRRLILTLTQVEVDKLNLDDVIVENINLRWLLQGAGIKVEELRALYGRHRSDWLSLDGRKKNIADELDKILADINQKYQTAYTWDPVPESFFGGSLSSIDQDIHALTVNPSVIVVDPIALFNARISNIFDRIQGCFQNRNSLILNFSLIEHSDRFKSLRKSLEVTKYQFHFGYFNPPIPRGNILAHLGANPLDEADARRNIQFFLADLNSGNNSPKSPFLIV